MTSSLFTDTDPAGRPAHGQGSELSESPGRFEVAFRPGPGAAASGAAAAGSEAGSRAGRITEISFDEESPGEMSLDDNNAERVQDAGQYSGQDGTGSGQAGLARLDKRVQAWIAEQGWQGLRPIQERSLEPVLSAASDVIISAATASGKTEAAFLPALSHVAAHPCQGTAILYISPLKALINDQFRRLQDLARRLDLSVIPWHGDLPWADKQAYLNSPGGLLLTTPESLEGFLLRYPLWCYRAFSALGYVIIDEFHSFVSNERGRQLLSQLRRLEALAHRTIPRLALSATFGNEDDMVQELRPHRQDYPCVVIKEPESRRPLMQLMAYLDVPPFLRSYVQERGLEQMMDDLYHMLQGGHHLVFTNSRARAELVASHLARKCRDNGQANEFFPHHGSLSRDLRQQLEQRLQAADTPTTAVCTMTLELGIDIGNMDSVSQLDAPNSVASLRQRLGRAGRRGSRQTIRVFLLEHFLLRNASLGDRLRLGLFQTLAVFKLLNASWYEPVESPRPHFSTLVQQILSVIGQYQGVKPSHLWNLLCATGPFAVSQEDFVALLRGLVNRKILCRDEESRELRLAEAGQIVTGRSDFSTAFSTPSEFLLENEGRVIGKLPLTEPLQKGMRILFAGRSWKVETLDEAEARIGLVPDNEGTPPRFAGSSQAVHDRVRETMYELYTSGAEPSFGNHTARRLFREGRKAFASMNLARSSMVYERGRVHLFPWRGDRFCRTVAALLRLADLEANEAAGIIDVPCKSPQEFQTRLRRFLRSGKPPVQALTRGMQDRLQEKFYQLVEPELCDRDNAARFYERDEAWDWLESVAGQPCWIC